MSASGARSLLTVEEEYQLRAELERAYKALRYWQHFAERAMDRRYNMPAIPLWLAILFEVACAATVAAIPPEVPEDGSINPPTVPPSGRVESRISDDGTVEIQGSGRPHPLGLAARARRDRLS